MSAWYLGRRKKRPCVSLVRPQISRKRPADRPAGRRRGAAPGQHRSHGALARGLSPRAANSRGPRRAALGGRRRPAGRRPAGRTLFCILPIPLPPPPPALPPPSAPRCLASPRSRRRRSATRPVGSRHTVGEPGERVCHPRTPPDPLPASTTAPALVTPLRPPLLPPPLSSFNSVVGEGWWGEREGISSPHLGLMQLGFFASHSCFQ